MVWAMRTSLYTIRALHSNAKHSFIPRKEFPKYNVILSNFQGHHQKALTRFRHLAPQIDLVIELRDARAPVATSNLLFDHVLGGKEKIVLYTKQDLLSLSKKALADLHSRSRFMMIDSRSKADAKAVLELVKAKYYEMTPRPPLGLRLMVIGMPNVGKSTFVNTLRQTGYQYSSISSKRSNVAKTGGQPGVTRATSEMIRICEDPDLLMHDTPGVFLPSVKNAETMITLALIGCVLPTLVDPVIQADYLLYVLNLQDPKGLKYREYCPYPTNNVDELLFHIAKKRGVLKKNDSFDELGMATHWVNRWRQGKFKQYKGCFDSELLGENAMGLLEAFEEEKERVRYMAQTTAHLDRFSQGKGNRDRTAKDREWDLKNTLFKR